MECALVVGVGVVRGEEELFGVKYELCGSGIE